MTRKNKDTQQTNERILHFLGQIHEMAQEVEWNIVKMNYGVAREKAMQLEAALFFASRDGQTLFAGKGKSA
jgi:hypothetical protein